MKRRGRPLLPGRLSGAGAGPDRDPEGDALVASGDASGEDVPVPSAKPVLSGAPGSNASALQAGGREAADTPEADAGGEDSHAELEKLMGLGERSLRKSYYPELRRKIAELERFQVLVDNAMDFIFLMRLDPPGVVHANHAAMGCFQGSTPLDMLDVESVLGWNMAEEIRLFAAHRQRTEHVTFQTMLPRFGCPEIPVEVTASLHELDGVGYAVIVARDIRQRLEDMEEKRSLRLLLANILDAMPSVLVGVDPQGHVVQWNRQAAVETGTDARTALGRPLAEVMPRVAHLMDDVWRAMETDQPVSLARNQVRNGSRLRFENVTIFPLPAQAGGAPAGAVVRLDDVTEQVRLEQVMIQTEKMMSVGGLAAGMAHEINNPLGGILQGAQNILRRLSPELPANVQAAESVGCPLDSVHAYMQQRQIMRMLEGIRDSAVRAADIVANMLSFSRKSETAHSTHDINEIVDSTIRLASTDYDLKKSFDFRHIDIVREYAADLPPITCSRTEIEQVLLNLLRNAAQAMVACEGPRIVLRTGMYEGDGTPGVSGRHVLVEVEDNGPGMDEQTKMRVFEPFFTTKDPGVGTGLGLSVSYFIITENHRGHMEVESEPGSGTRFTILLPMAGRGSGARGPVTPAQTGAHDPGTPAQTGAHDSGMTVQTGAHDSGMTVRNGEQGSVAAGNNGTRGSGTDGPNGATGA
ncbi:PAS domain-containing sensor histidine kinase [Desulfovibrio psychrotolerans]|uniref:histidine kinase n=1 Tax=Desulfovibrio psychrotolerans TaxID=415242 RepID=A0A7J0BSE2_9BACT|nr:ATP-binding protein [Desulfovibrio psychrotolerans]GFM36609.1 hypothetical protein DSM19430T_12930 [Desulfovibrio psychrotolerans]